MSLRVIEKRDCWHKKVLQEELRNAMHWAVIKGRSDLVLTMLKRSAKSSQPDFFFLFFPLLLWHLPPCTQLPSAQTSPSSAGSGYPRWDIKPNLHSVCTCSQARALSFPLKFLTVSTGKTCVNLAENVQDEACMQAFDGCTQAWRLFDSEWSWCYRPLVLRYATESEFIIWKWLGALISLPQILI